MLCIITGPKHYEPMSIVKFISTVKNRVVSRVRGVPPTSCPVHCSIDEHHITSFVTTLSPKGEHEHYNEQKRKAIGCELKGEEWEGEITNEAVDCIALLKSKYAPPLHSRM